MQFTRIYLKEIDSTHTFAIEMLSKSKPKEFTAISTFNQHHGRGQIGRHWFSDVDLNITSSLICYPSFLSLEYQHDLNMLLSNSLLEVLQTYNIEDIYIKWPNDIYISNKKIAGLLIYNALRGNKIAHTVCSVGLNVNQSAFPRQLPNPTSLKLETLQTFNLEDLETKIWQQFHKNYLEYKTFGNRALLKRKYIQHLYKRGELVFFSTQDERTISGEILGISDNGQLAINMNQKVLYFGYHEIKMIK